MRKLYTLFILISGSILFGQEYRPMLGENNFWKITNLNSFGDGEYFGMDYEKRLIDEIIVINEREYVGLESRSRIVDAISGPGEWSEWSSGDFYLHENINEKKVYAYDANSEEEYLLYDFNLEVGSTVNIGVFDNYDEFQFETAPTIISITYENVLGIENVKTFHTDCQWDSDFVIYEGIGASTGITTLSRELDYIWMLTDFSNTLGLNEKSKIQTKIYPNPFSDKIQIQNSEEIKEIQLFDLQGKLISKNKKLDELNSKLSSLNNAVYFLIITFKNNKCSSPEIK